jgi:hypothetical protein
VAVEDDVDALYAGDPDEFVAGRQALVKRLRSEGDRARAAEVAQLRRPTAAAWAVNQLARRHPDELASLVELGRAHERLLSGGRDDATVTSGRRRREAIAGLVERAARILSESGRSPDAHRDAIASTLDAASLDPGPAEEVVAGRLARELDPPSGFGPGGDGGDGDDGELLWVVPDATRAAPKAPAAKPVTEKPAADKPAADKRTAPEKQAATEPAVGKAGGGRPAGDPSPTASEEAEREEEAERAERAAARERRAEEKRRRATTARAAAIRARDLADQAQDAADHAERERERLEEEVVRARRTATDSRRAARELRDAAREAERQATALEQDTAP